jgi:flavin reductase (DIM6/NTAB) family NADH-FMN oxidoreductase RutF
VSAEQLDFRRVAGLFATGVTVVTSASGDAVRAMTANSLATVSLDPLSLLVCVNREAVTYRFIVESGAFCVNVLREEQEALSRACARPDSPEAGLEGVAYELGKTGAPVLTDALAYFECGVAASLEFGTHTIFVGRVLSFGEGVGRPLLFYRGKYTVLTETI